MRDEVANSWFLSEFFTCSLSELVKYNSFIVCLPILKTQQCCIQLNGALLPVVYKIKGDDLIIPSGLQIYRCKLHTLSNL